jgi:hypothetical protein
MQQLIWLVSMGLLALFLMVGPAAAVNVKFNFDQGLGPNFTFHKVNTTDVALDTTGGNLRIYSSGMGGSGVRGGEVLAKFTIHGDFDIVVDFNILQALENLQQVEVHPYNMGTFYVIRDNEAGDNYHVWTGAVRGRTTTSDLTGTLRAMRVGTTAFGYFWNKVTDEYSLLYSGGVSADDVSLGLMVQNNSTQGGSFNAAFDNLSITADRIDGLVPPGGLLGSSFLLLLEQ